MKIRLRYVVVAAIALFIALLYNGYRMAETKDAIERVTSVSDTGSDVSFDQTLEVPSQPAFGVDARPVRIGLDGADFDACGSFGTITGLDPDGDNFLSVRAAPTTNAEELDRLDSGTGVSMCERADGWIGIVYQGSGAAGTDCGVGSPVDRERDYNGACRSGWISERFVELIAG